MHALFIVLQVTGIILLIAEIMYVNTQRASTLQRILFFFEVAMLINCFGYLLELLANTKELAHQAVKVTYLGKPFVILGMLYLVLYYCKIRIPKLLNIVLIAIHLSVTFLVFTSDYIHLFYKKIDYSYDGVFPHLVLTYGIIYYLYTGLMIVYMFAMLFTCTKLYRKAKERAEKNQIICLVSMILTPFIGLVLFFMKVTFGYDTTMPAYLVTITVLQFSIFKYNLLDTVDIAKDEVMDIFSEGLIVVDDKDNIIYVNEPAMTIYPELKGNQQALVLSDIRKNESDNAIIQRESRYYTLYQQDIVKNEKYRGKLYVLTDVTDSYTYTERLQADVRRKTKELSEIQHHAIVGFANMIEARDGITGQHIKNTSSYVEIIANELYRSGEYSDVMTWDYKEAVIATAPLHDIGKISIPDVVLKKPGKLTDEEFNIIKTHPVIGAQIIDETLSLLEDKEYVKVATEVAYYHHEKWDGSGYPEQLGGNEIPVCARIMAIADVYDALRSERSYKKAFSKEKSRTIIAESSGSHFDPVIVNIFFKCIDKIEAVSKE